MKEEQPMNEKLYDLINWEQVEAVVYADTDAPQDILGIHKVKGGYLIQAFMPKAETVAVKTKTAAYPMECVDEAGFYAVLVPERAKPDYTLSVVFDNGTLLETADPYTFGQILTEGELKKFDHGIYYDSYEKLGAHPMTVEGTKGVYFAVWAPNALRVSVVGDFNNWDGRRHMMKRLGDHGVFELFIPGLGAGTVYKYELKIKGDIPILKADPYGNQAELRPNTASIVADLTSHRWKDAKWLEKRAGTQYETEPVNIYEVHLGSWMKPEEGEEREFYNYREIAPKLADYVRKMHYTHVELMPVMEHPLDASWGYQVTGYYAATARYGTPDDFMYFMDYMHQKGIGVILDWVPAHFPKDAFGLACFDGTNLYEHHDLRQGEHPHWGTLIYNYGRPQVSNFLISNALFWIEKYHADGIRMDAVASMLYLDYGKNDGEWVANLYGSNENLEAIEFIRNLNAAVRKRKDGALLMAEESTAWPQVTGDVKDGALGFHLKWNMGWMNDFTNYMKTDPLFRSGCHGMVTFSMVYAYSENFILVLSHDEVVHGKGSMIGKMPGEYEEKFANLRAAYGFMTAHPGKKLLFMGQEFAQFAEWNENKGLDWMLPEEYDSHRQMQTYVAALNEFYLKHPALYQQDFDPEGFEWINCMDAQRSIFSFIRKSAGETLLFVVNFTPVLYEDYQVGVPFAGKYKEIFNSEKEIYGGGGAGNPRMKQSKAKPSDGRKDSIFINVPPMSMIVFSCTKAAKAPARKAAAKEGKTSAPEGETNAQKTSLPAEKAKAGEKELKQVKNPEKPADSVKPADGKKAQGAKPRKKPEKKKK